MILTGGFFLFNMFVSTVLVIPTIDPPTAFLNMAAVTIPFWVLAAHGERTQSLNERFRVWSFVVIWIIGLVCTYSFQGGSMILMGLMILYDTILPYKVFTDAKVANLILTQILTRIPSLNLTRILSLILNS